MPMSGHDACSLIHHWQVPDEAQDDLGQVLSDLEEVLAKIADVDRDTDETGMVIVKVTPRNPEALPITWICQGSEITLQAGRYGGMWELSRADDDIAFMQRVIRSITAGRVRETFGPKRSRVDVTLEDGTTVAETGYESWLPRPGWRRRGRTVAYKSYTG